MAAFLSALALCVATPGGAALYEITFTDGGANAGSGQINVVGGFATSGSFDVTAGAASGLIWTLYTAGGTATPPAVLLSPSRAEDYDNAVFPHSNPFLSSTGGLLFTDPNHDELNIWGNGAGSYGLSAYINGAYHPYTVYGVATINAIPEPTNYALAAFGLVFVGVGAGRFYLAQRRSATAS